MRRFRIAPEEGWPTPMRRDDLRRHDCVSIGELRQILTDPVLITLFDYWCDRRSVDGCMPRDRLNPAEIRMLLPHVFITEPLENARRHRYRLVGTFIQSQVRQRVEGLCVEDIRHGAMLDHLNDLFRTVATTRQAGLSVSALDGGDLPSAIYRRLALPMSKDGADVDQILGGWVVEYDTVVPPENQVLNPEEHPVSLSFAAGLD